MQYTIRHTIETDVDGFWKLTFDAELLQAIHRHLGSVCKLLEQRTDERGVLHRTLEYSAPLELPSMATKLVGDGSCTETGHFDPAAKRYRAQTVPKIGADKFQINLDLFAEPLAANRCERVLVMENIVKIIGLGPALEKILEQPQREAQDRAVAFMNAWIKERAA